MPGLSLEGFLIPFFPHFLPHHAPSKLPNSSLRHQMRSFRKHLVDDGSGRKIKRLKTTIQQEFRSHPWHWLLSTTVKKNLKLTKLINLHYNTRSIQGKHSFFFFFFKKESFQYLPLVPCMQYVSCFHQHKNWNAAFLFWLIQRASEMTDWFDQNWENDFNSFTNSWTWKEWYSWCHHADIHPSECHI